VCCLCFVGGLLVCGWRVGCVLRVCVGGGMFVFWLGWRWCVLWCVGGVLPGAVQVVCSCVVGASRALRWESVAVVGSVVVGGVLCVVCVFRMLCMHCMDVLYVFTDCVCACIGCIHCVHLLYVFIVCIYACIVGIDCMYVCIACMYLWYDVRV
jgi:hypothetical protein